jgi:membrane associated rhomboid family serine protease
MFVLADGNPVHAIDRPYVTWGLIALNVVVFALQLGGAVPTLELALLPAQLTQPAALGPDAAATPFWMTLVTYQFLHVDTVHLAINMIALWVFGDNIEDSMGHGRFAVFYLVCGVLGGLVQALLTPFPLVGVIGASGAIAGVMGAYLLLHPRARVLVLVLNRFPLLVPAWAVIGVAIGGDIVMATRESLEGARVSVANVAWWAHLGGFAAGALLIVPVRRPDVPLLQPRSAYPEVAFPRFMAWLQDEGTPVWVRVLRLLLAFAALGVLVALLNHAGA